MEEESSSKKEEVKICPAENVQSSSSQLNPGNYAFLPLPFISPIIPANSLFPFYPPRFNPLTPIYNPALPVGLNNPFLRFPPPFPPPTNLLPNSAKNFNLFKSPSNKDVANKSENNLVINKSQKDNLNQSSQKNSKDSYNKNIHNLKNGYRKDKHSLKDDHSKYNHSPNDGHNKYHYRHKDDHHKNNYSHKNDYYRNSYKYKDSYHKNNSKDNNYKDAYRQNNCLKRQRSPEESSDQSERNQVNAIFTKKIKYIKSSPLLSYYEKSSKLIDGKNVVFIEGTKYLIDLRTKFKEEVLDRADKFRSQKPAFSFPKRKIKLKAHKHYHDECGVPCDSDSDMDSEIDDNDNDENSSLKELERKKTHPWRLHPELWYNEPGEMNDGLLCRCSLKAQRSGIRHGIYLGEEHLPKCDPNTNNRDRLFHYVININPKTNFTTEKPTSILHNDKLYYFEGYSIFSHFPLPSSFPPCKMIRYNISYMITHVEEEFPENFCVGELDLVFNYIFYELLELVDFNLKAKDDNDGCFRFHFMPRFVRLLENDGKEILSMSAILQYLYEQSKPLIEEKQLDSLSNLDVSNWNEFIKKHKGYLVTSPSMKPCTIRIDQIDQEKDGLIENKRQKLTDNTSEDKFPVIVHFGIRPPQLSYAGNPKYQRAWRDYVKYRHLLAIKEKVSYQDKQVLAQKEEKLQEMRSKSDLKRDVTVVVSSKNFYCTGLQCDVVQHSMIMPVIVSHLRFHYSLQHLEKLIDYTFKDRSLLQLSLTHPSYRENFGTNSDHARNTLTNCGPRFIEYGDRKVHFMNTRKRGINMLINIMSRFGCNEETISNINHNERLEFLGDAVVEFIASIHLYFLFPNLEEGGLATFRAALVQNQHLAVLAKKLQLEKFMLYAHGSDLCHDLELRHAMANCFEAFMGALFLDGDIKVADKVFSSTLFNDVEEKDILHKIWVNYPPHPLQSEFPDGDRHIISSFNRLKDLCKFEETVGIEFKHIRLLARAFTHRSVGYNNLTLGSNQRMEFLGDTVLQLIASDYLYKYFPDHHEGHLSLLRSSLVNNKTQSVVCDDLGIVQLTQYNSNKSELKTKDRADLLEAFIGALFVDKGIEYCRRFCEICFFPRLQQFIMNQDWNDPKSKLQQCCLTLRSVDNGEPDIPTYKVIESRGPTNTRIYEVAVYFRDKRLATGKGHSIQEAEMNAATNALKSSKELFPHLKLQKRVMQRNIKHHKDGESLNKK